MKLLVKLLLFVIPVVSALPVSARAHTYTLASPDGRLVVLVASDPSGGFVYDMAYDGQVLMDHSRMDLEYRMPNGGCRLSSVRKVSHRTINSTVASPFTRQSSMYDHCNEMTLHLKGAVSLVMRAYNDGFAYRYRWEGKPGHVVKETVEYHFAADWNATVPYVTNFDSTNHASQYGSSFENLYTTSRISRLDCRRLCFLPLLVHADGGVKICLTESTLLDYPGLYLHASGSRGVLLGDHAPLPKREVQGGHNNLQMLVKEREDYIAAMDASRLFPWRIVMVASNSVALASNNLSYLLGEPSRIDDISWIRPGKVAWEWWNCWNIEGVPFVSGINNETYRHYIDFASRYGIEYVILDEGWTVNRQADLFQVVPEIDLPMLVQYASQRNVGIILWAGYYAFERDMEEVCRHYAAMGIKGFKIDFMDRDDQRMTAFYRRAAETCARHRLLVDFHGAFKPAGLNRTYPNVLNFEGVAGLEQLKWAPSSWNQVQYDVEIPFIRQTAGPMDYTQGAMRNGAQGCYYPCWSEPMSQGTRCHQLALYVVLESPLNMLCDSPSNYDREPDYTRFVASLPTVWDETRVLQGEVGEYIVVARRKGNSWYVGGITNWTPRDISVDLGALSGNPASVELFVDGANAHRKGSDYSHQILHGDDARLSGALNVHMAPGGGFLIKVQ